MPDNPAGPGLDHFWAVVPAGGAGTRLWPLSRSGSPKFLHDLTGSGRSLLQDTVARVGTLAGARVVVVTGAGHRDRVLEQLPGVPPDQVVGEPSPRDSMAAIGLAAALVERADPDAVIGSFAADHVVRHPEAFERAVAVAVSAARDDWLVTVGIEPTHPSTAFGYVQQGAPLRGHDGAYVVEQFVEKPSREVAEGYLAAGDYRWNAGMFVVRPRVLLDLLAVHHPALAASLRDLAAHPDLMGEIWPSLTKIAIDHAVAEPAAAAGRVATVPADLGWDDVGDFASLSAALTDAGEDAEAGGVQVLGDASVVRAVDATGVVAPGTRLVAVVGVDDIVVVDTPDALLVTTRARAQEVKAMVDLLRETGRADLT
jgi:mannose-1-phosphate guanylyltransferase